MAADADPRDDLMDDDPFASFTEWSSEADQRAYAGLENPPDLNTQTPPRSA